MTHWCESRGVLESVFQFSGSSLSQHQATDQVNDLSGLLLRCIQEASGNPFNLWHLSKRDADAIYLAARILQGERVTDTWSTECRASVHDIRWFGAYGCAVVAVLNVRGGHETLAPIIVGLDSWDFFLGGPSNQSYSANSHGHALLYNLALPKEGWPQLLEIVDELIKEAAEKARQTDNRTAAKKQRGYQHTPAFISSIFHDAALKLTTGEESVSDPRGGFTDVGLHTGGQRRDTCWALVREVAQVLLSHVLPLQKKPATLSSKQLVAVAEASLCLWLLERQVALLTPDTATPAAVTAVVDMLEQTALKGARIADGFAEASHQIMRDGPHVHGDDDDDVVEATPMSSSHNKPAGAVSSIIRRHGKEVSDRDGMSDLRRGSDELAARLLEARRKLDGLVQAREELRAATYRLPEEGHVVAPAIEEPKVELPARLLLGASSDSDLMALAMKNLGGLPILPPHATVRRALDWVQHPLLRPGQATNELRAQLALRGMEQVVFSAAVAARARDGHGWVRWEVVPKDLVALVESYRTLLGKFLSLEGSAARMQVEMRSKETLMVWAAFCFADAAACAPDEFPLFREYGVALRWEDLEHLVLSDRLAVDAALAVGEYLRTRTVPSREVFTLRDAGAGWDAKTIAMATELAERSRVAGQMRELWRSEEADAAKRVEGHWREVLRKQRLVRELRAEIAGLEGQLPVLEKDRDTALEARSDADKRSKWSYGTRLRNSAYDEADEKVSRAQEAVDICNRRIRARKDDLAEAKKSPPPVYQPLPANEKKSLALLLLMNMPESLRQAAQLAFTAQQMLLPYPWKDPGGRWDIAKSTEEPSFTREWHGYYNSQQRCEYHTPAVTRKASTGMVLLGTRDHVPAWHAIGPQDVERCVTDSDGIWHPDTLAPSLGWKGCGFSPAESQELFNPFAVIPRRHVVDYHTELLRRASGDAPLSPLQWALPQYGTKHTDATRGSIAIAEQAWRPAWMSKPEYLAFGALRAYPHQQVRKLCVALRDKLLPLDQPAVHTLLRMAAYHLGELDVHGRNYGSNAANSNGAGGELFPRWHTDLWVGGAADTLCAELAALLDELRPAPRRHPELSIVAELAGFFGERHEGCLQVARGFGYVARQWGDELEAQLEEDVGVPGPKGEEKGERGDLTRAIRSRQRLFYLYSLLCYSAGPLSVADARSVVELVVLISYTRVFEEGGEGDDTSKAEPDKKVAVAGLTKAGAFTVLCQNVMAGRMGDVLEVLEGAGARNDALTSAFKLAVQWGTPDNLDWKVAEDSRACFHASSHDGRLYSINALTGSVLVDGSPPGRLPLTILEHPLYKAVFGDTSFEVSVTADRIYGTTRATRGRFYEFAMLQSERLLAVEIDSRKRWQRLELLDPKEAWASDLPVRVRELHSHWLCRNRAMHPRGLPFVVFRPRGFRQHQASFVMECGAGGTGSCWRVPEALCWQPYTALVGGLRDQLTQKLMLSRAGSEDPLLCVLDKFEPQRFIHIFRKESAEAEPLVYFHLPRLKLEFVLQEGRVESLDYRGYVLASDQQLVSPVALPEFIQYLVLQPSARSNFPSTRAATHGLPDTRVVMPQGFVAKAPECDRQAGLSPSVYIERDDENCDASLSTHTYTLHGRWHALQAGGISARLQLAAVYAAAGSSAPLPGSIGGMTGPEAALALVRQCRVGHPLALGDVEQLRRVAAFGIPLLPALTLACNALERSSLELHFLHTEGTPRWRPGLASAGSLVFPDEQDAVTAYLHKCRKMPTHSRRRLTEDEAAQELACAGGEIYVGAAAGDGLGRAMPEHGMLDVGPCPIADDYLATVESNLQSFRRVQKKKGPGMGKKKLSAAAAVQAPYMYPLAMPSQRGVLTRGASRNGVGSSVLDRKMHNELRASWEQHHGAPEVTLQATVRPPSQSMDRYFQAELARVAKDRACVEQYLLEALQDMPSYSGWHAPAARMLASASILPAVTLQDMARMACAPSLIAQWNPFLSHKAKEVVHESILVWLQLCVLEDKMARLLAHATAGDEARLLQELGVVREWDVRKHPHWLVFEADNGLQIRPEQHAVARHMIHNPGSIVQLNMGEGKTRVILPMLALHWADGTNTVRLNLLSSLLDEAHDYLHNCLCAGVLGRRLTILSFNRDVQISERQARTILHHVDVLAASGGILIAAPEHRLSLKLKGHELASQPGTFQWLERLDGRDVIDILDESDELLHHRRELIYACGSPIPLPNGSVRWTTMQALFGLLRQGIRDHGEIRQILTRPGVCVGLELAGEEAARDTSVSSSNGGEAAHANGEFIPVRLVPGDALTACLPELRTCLLRELMRDPPYEMPWMAKVDPDTAARIVRFVTDPGPEGQGLLGSILPEGALCEMERATLLILRGLLAGDFFFLELQKRHLVEYGVDRRVGAGRKKRLAVPFRAHNQPSDRSEWKNPEAALLLTTLAYYYDGLSLGEMTECLATLLGMAPSTQRFFYDAWLALCDRPDVDAALSAMSSAGVGIEEEGTAESGAANQDKNEWAEIDMVEKVDLTNKVKLAVLHRKLGRNMGVVNFWLAYCLFPRETNQFEKRLSASAWDLAQPSGSKGRVVGFSGTNDIHRLMPLQVRQNDLPALRGTSGKMLALLLRGSYITLPAEAATSWQAVLELCMARGSHALLDAGAFLVGVSNAGAAEYLLPSSLSSTGASGGRVASSGADAIEPGANSMPAGMKRNRRGNEELSHSSRRGHGGDSIWVQQPGQPPPRLPPLSSLRAAFKERFPGVVFFDTTRREWMVRDRSGWCVPLARSPISPADVFVIYDESRCRGTDFKLRADALAVVTLSARMTKDKLMQAAGRMRQLDKGQRLLLVGNQELSDKVVKACALAGNSGAECIEGGNAPGDIEGGNTPAASPAQGKQGWRIRPSHVMQVVMDNTVEATEDGLVHATLQGVHFASTFGAPHRALADEDVSLGTMYEAALAEERVAEMVNCLVQAGKARCIDNGGLDGSMAALMERIRKRGAKYGGDFSVVVSQVALGGECERELELQAERETEEEVQLPQYKPRDELAWNYASILRARSPRDLPTQVLSLRDAMAWLVPPGLQKAPWADGVMMTYNFLQGTQENDVGFGQPPAHGTKLNEFLRAVDAMVWFPDSGETLLLSEREADSVLALLWERDGLVHPRTPLTSVDQVGDILGTLATGRVVMVHRSFACGPAAPLNKRPAPAAAEIGTGLDAGNAPGRPNFTFLSGQVPAVVPPHSTFPCDGCMGALPPGAATSLLLFSGVTYYSRQDHRDQLRCLLRGDVTVAKEVVAMRDRLHHYPRSDLEQVTRRSTAWSSEGDI
eukprot:jgi/Mesvir1/14718/Mv05368-RA.1